MNFDRDGLNLSLIAGCWLLGFCSALTIVFLHGSM